MYVKYSIKLKLNDRLMEIYRRLLVVEIVDIYIIFGIWWKDKVGILFEIYIKMKYMNIV